MTDDQGTFTTQALDYQSGLNANDLAFLDKDGHLLLPDDGVFDSSNLNPRAGIYFYSCNNYTSYKSDPAIQTGRLEQDAYLPQIEALQAPLPYGKYLLQELPTQQHPNYDLISLEFQIDSRSAKQDGSPTSATLTQNLGELHDMPIELSTKLLTAEGESVLPRETSVKLIDHLNYSGLRDQRQYLVKAKLVGIDKNAEEHLIDECELELQPEENQTTGEIAVPFVLDTHGHEGWSFVATETIWDGEYCIAQHNDLNNEQQTLRLPEHPLPHTSDNLNISFQALLAVVSFGCFIIAWRFARSARHALD